MSQARVGRGFNGIAIQIGLAEKFYWDYAGGIPLVLKLNGKTDIPPDTAPLSPVNATVADAVRLGADAAGYTLYVGSPAQERDSFYAVDYAARTASELGADVVKVNFPRPGRQYGAAQAYRHEFSSQEAIDEVVRSANRTLVLVSGGERAGDDAMPEKARESMGAGATGLIFGRNIWQHEHGESQRLVARLKDILAKYSSG